MSPPEPDAPAAPTEPVENLLRATEATVIASSGGGRDPEGQVRKLVDGDLETAWNGATGDLEGFIGFRIPAEARVTSIGLTAGYTRQSRPELFTGNYRLRKVRVTRDGELVRELTLDPESRELQRFDVEGPGGEWRIQAVETLPGDHYGWSELCVSELVVQGIPTSLGRDEAPATALVPGDLSRLARRALDRFQTLVAADPSMDIDMPSVALSEPAGAPRFGTVGEMGEARERVTVRGGKCYALVARYAQELRANPDDPLAGEADDPPAPHPLRRSTAARPPGLPQPPQPPPLPATNRRTSPPSRPATTSSTTASASSERRG